MKKICLCCQINKGTILYQNISFYNVCFHLVSNKVASNYKNWKTTKAIDIILEMNNLTEQELFERYKSIKGEKL